VGIEGAADIMKANLRAALIDSSNAFVVVRISKMLQLNDVVSWENRSGGMLIVDRFNSQLAD
jgi:hypothetical protein